LKQLDLALGDAHCTGPAHASSAAGADDAHPGAAGTLEDRFALAALGLAADA
jgi:hypothetical protein